MIRKEPIFYNHHVFEAFVTPSFWWLGQTLWYTSSELDLLVLQKQSSAFFNKFFTACDCSQNHFRKAHNCKFNFRFVIITTLNLIFFSPKNTYQYGLTIYFPQYISIDSHLVSFPITMFRGPGSLSTYLSTSDKHHPYLHDFYPFLLFI